MSIWSALWRDEGGQDLTEYALLLAFIGLTTAALVVGPGSLVSTMWVTGDNTLNSAAAYATS